MAPANAIELAAASPRGIYVDGEWRQASGARTFEVADPATGETLVDVADAGSEDGAAALDAASRAQSSWAATPARERAEFLRAAFELTLERAEDLATLMTLEMGKPLAESRGEVTYGA